MGIYISKFNSPINGLKHLLQLKITQRNSATLNAHHEAADPKNNRIDAVNTFQLAGEIKDIRAAIKILEAIAEVV